MFALCTCAAHYRDLSQNPRFIDIVKCALQNSYHETFDCDFFHTLLLFLCNFFDADAANVQFADISEVLEMTAVCSFMMLYMFIDLVHMACDGLMSTDEEMSFVERVVCAAVQIKRRTKNGHTLLHLAVAHVVYCGKRYSAPSRAIVKSLLAAGAPVNWMDADGNRPLHVAVFNEPGTSLRDVWLDVIDLLLQYGADVDFVNVDRETASDLLPSSVDVFEHVSLKCLATHHASHLPRDCADHSRRLRRQTLDCLDVT